MNYLKRFCIIGAVVTIVLGILSHFVYDWTGQNFCVGLFFPINESTWEHMKLVYFPMLLVTLTAGRFLEKRYPCIYDAMFLGTFAGLFLLPVLFYTYSGILGFRVDWINIAIYIISILASYLVVYLVASDGKERNSKLIRYIYYAFLLAFMIFTVYPPGIGLFTFHFKV